MSLKLSIVTTTYNSAGFLEGTINAVLNQNTDFEFEYIISDDGSTDNTLEVIDNIKSNHRNGKSIRTIVNKENQGVMKNFFGAIKETKGEFIAFCDSDDVWGDQRKLLKQISYMEKNKNCVITFHRYLNKVTENLKKSQLKQFEEPVNQIIEKPQTSTMMVAGILRELVNANVVNEAQGPQNDQYLRFLLQDKGYFKLLDYIEPNVRVVRESSIFSTVNMLTKKMKSLHSWETFYKYHGIGKNKNYLERKVQGYTSAVKWLEYKEHKEVSQLKVTICYDLKTGVFIRRLKANLRKVLLKPLVNLNQLFAKN